MITSKQNSLVKEIRSLSDKKFRDRLGVFVVEGIKPVKEAIALGLNIREVIVTDKGFTALDGYLSSVKTETATEEVFSSISEEITPQGALAVVFKPNNELLSPRGRALILDGVSDPANVGAIIRTAAASGYNDVYMTDDSADPYSQKAVRASMSGVFRIRIMRGTREDILNTVNLPIWIADMDGKDLFDVKTDGAFCLVIGNEGRGVSKTFKEKADFTVSIPMENGVESLNAAVSAGILMYNLKA